jgi:hypothetical protein
MLSVGFYNLAKSKKPPVIHIEKQFSGVRLTLKDDAGDELQIVLSPETFAAITEWSDKFLAESQRAA